MCEWNVLAESLLGLRANTLVHYDPWEGDLAMAAVVAAVMFGIALLILLLR